MKSFENFLESHIFQLPKEAAALVPQLQQRLRDLSADKNFTGSVLLAELPDPFSDKKITLWANDFRTYQKNVPSASQGAFGVAQGQPQVVFRVPMTDYDTIYHELVHAYDPQYRKSLIKSDQLSSHEILAYFSGKIALAQTHLRSLPVASRQRELQELMQWLQKVKTSDELDPYNVPDVFRGLAKLHFIYENPGLKRQFISRVYNDILAKFTIS